MKKQSGFQLLTSAKWYAFRRPWQALLRLSLFDRRSRRRGSAERGSVPRKHIRPAIQPASGSVGLQLATAAAAQVAVTDFLIIMTKTYVTHAILFLFSEVASCLPSRFPPFSFCFHIFRRMPGLPCESDGINAAALKGGPGRPFDGSFHSSGDDRLQCSEK